MTDVESMDYTHFYLSIIASLFGTVHCPFSPRESVQTSPVHPNPVIRYALSHISLILSSSNSHHTYLLSRNGYGNAIIGRYGGCFEEDIRRLMFDRAYRITGFGCTGEVCTNSQGEKGQCTVPKRLAMMEG